MRSAWICTRNDVLGNLAVLLAAAGVFGTGTGWPDVIVAAIMAGLALQGATTLFANPLANCASQPAFLLSNPVCPLWVKSRHMRCKNACPLYPQ